MKTKKTLYDKRDVSCAVCPTYMFHPKDTKAAIKKFISQLNYHIIGNMSEDKSITNKAEEIFGKELTED